MSAGAYGFVMASNYNTRCLAAEVMVKGNRAALVRERQPLKEIWSGEAAAPWLK
jgi:diaminopimelate decarboxylase